MPIGASGTDAGHQDDVDGQDKEEEEIGRQSGVQDHERRSDDQACAGSRSRTNDKAEKRKKAMPGLRVSVW